MAWLVVFRPSTRVKRIPSTSMSGLSRPATARMASMMACTPDSARGDGSQGMSTASAATRPLRARLPRFGGQSTTMTSYQVRVTSRASRSTNSLPMRVPRRFSAALRLGSTGVTSRPSTSVGVTMSGTSWPDWGAAVRTSDRAPPPAWIRAESAAPTWPWGSRSTRRTRSPCFWARAAARFTLVVLPALLGGRDDRGAALAPRAGGRLGGLGGVDQPPEMD